MENQNIINEEKGNDVNHVLAPVIAGWISVNEKLPDEGECVLVYGTAPFEHKFQIGGSFYELMCFYKGEFVNVPDNKYSKNVTHWMELPTPPCVG